MDFDDPTGLARLDAMSAAELDGLGFGVVRMRENGHVVAYNAAVGSLPPHVPAGQALTP